MTSPGGAGWRAHTLHLPSRGHGHRTSTSPHWQRHLACLSAARTQVAASRLFARSPVHAQVVQIGFGPRCHLLFHIFDIISLGRATAPGPTSRRWLQETRLQRNASFAGGVGQLRLEDALRQAYVLYVTPCTSQGSTLPYCTRSSRVRRIARCAVCCIARCASHDTCASHRQVCVACPAACRIARCASPQP